MADNVRAAGAVDPAVLQDLVATLSRFGIRLPADLVVLSRSLVTLDGTLRVISPDAVAGRGRARCSSTDDADADHRSQRAASARSCWPRCRSSAGCPDRIDRILTLTGRGELRIRSVVDEDGRRIVRTLVNRAAARASSGSRSSSSSACCSSPPTPGPMVAERHRVVRDLRLRRPARRDGAAAAGRRGGRPGRHDVTSSTATPRRGRGGRAAPTTSPRGSATTATRATCSSSCSGARRRPARAPRAARDRHEHGAHDDVARATDRLPAVRELVLALAQVVALLAPVVVVVVLVVGRRWRRLGVLVAGRGAAARRSGRCSTRRSTWAPACRARSTTGTWVASTRFPASCTSRRGRGHRRSAGPGWRRVAAGAGRLCRAHGRAGASPGAAACPSSCWRSRRRRVRAPRSSSSSARRTDGRRRRRWQRR